MDAGGGGGEVRGRGGWGVERGNSAKYGGQGAEALSWGCGREAPRLGFFYWWGQKWRSGH